MKATEKLKTIVLTGRIYDLDSEKIIWKLDEKAEDYNDLKDLITESWVLRSGFRFY